MDAPAQAPWPEEAADAVRAESDSSVPAVEASTDQLQQERKVVYNANMTLVVADTETAASEVERMARDAGGYVAHMSSYRTDSGVVLYDVTIRVPADVLDAVRSSLRAMATRVESESLNTDDITDEYYDIDARLSTLQATETELLALLEETRERGGEVEDIMSIYRELTNIRSQIESLQGQLNRFDKLVALSTISIALGPDELSSRISNSWRPLETLHSSFRALVSALQGLYSVFVYVLVVVLPILLILAAPVILFLVVVRWFVRRRKAKGAAQD
jgi:DNA repair exonuclease SbcCD ATPase subunit